MFRAIYFGGLLLACAALSAADQKTAAIDQPQPRPPAMRPAPLRRAAPGVPKGGAGRGQVLGPPLSNPANPVTRLYRSSPEERERALEKLPPEMQQQFRNALQRFDALTPPQQQIVLRQNERFDALPVERKLAFRQQLQALMKMPPERRQPIVMALRRLETMPDEQRRNVVASDAFRTRFSPEERKMIEDLSVVMLPPM